MVYQRCFAFALTAALAAGAVAQERSAAPGGASEKAAGAPPLYQSAFADYKSFREPEVMSWRAANDQVREAGAMGGMAGHDMSKMDAAAVPAAGAAATSDKAAAPKKAMPTHDMGKMKAGVGGSMDMPGHDMASMGKATPAKPGPSAPKRPKKPATEVPQPMMDHSKMNNKE